MMLRKLLQKSDKGQIIYWSSQTCSRIRRLFVRCLSPCSKTWKLPYFRPFQPDTQILSALTALYWPSTAFYWPSTTKHQPVLTHTDPVPSCKKYTFFLQIFALLPSPPPKNIFSFSKYSNVRLSLEEEIFEFPFPDNLLLVAMHHLLNCIAFDHLVDDAHDKIQTSQ